MTDNFDEEEGPNFEELEELLAKMLGGDMAFDPSAFASFAGFPGDAANLMPALQQAMSGGDPWGSIKKVARDHVRKEPSHIDSDTKRMAADALNVASLWLDEVTRLGASNLIPRAITPEEWVGETVDTRIEITRPIGEAVTGALGDSLSENLPEEFGAGMQAFIPMIRNVGVSLFAAQLGSVIGKLALEVTSAGDIGVPVFTNKSEEGGVLVPHGIDSFASGLEQDQATVYYYFATREMAHARLFRQAGWLRNNLKNAISDFARGIHIDTEHIEGHLAGLDLQDPSEIQRLVSSGELIPPKTPEQEAAHHKLETMLALIEGWVDVVTEDATERLAG